MGRRRKYRMKRRWPIIMLIVLALCMLGGGYLFAMYWLYPAVPSDANILGDSAVETEELPEGRINMLLLGMDARKGETKARTDTIILASIDARGRQAAMLSIPRDTRVEIPGHGYDRINSANVYGGPELAVKTVEKLLGVPIDYYVLTNFNGFTDIVDTLGGVTIDVEKNMYYYDPTDDFLIDLKKGTQRMDGEKAIQYVRYRNDAMGDIARTQRQQKFLKALAEEMLQPSTIVKLPKLVPEIKRNVQTNLGVMDMLALARAGKNMNDIEIVSETLPGRFMDINGLSYWGVDPEDAKVVVAKLFKGEKVSNVVQASTITVGSPSIFEEEEEEPKEQNKYIQEREEQTEAEKKNNGSLAANNSVPGNYFKPGVNVSITPGTGDNETKEPPAEEQPSTGNTSDYEKDPFYNPNPFPEGNNAGEGLENPISSNKQSAADSDEAALPKDVLADSEGNEG
ncbi:LCP family protein [Desulfolucanica intricata]|uniref:LCP family protein n=1 Tax=Desulfolucanica intricata TaxID=1285191 RepID=UPI0008370796|nr:LCP family protein [Desulfolucanica intricata]